MRLIEGKRRERYEVMSVTMEDEVFRRMETIGFTKGAVVEILHRNWNGSMVIYIRKSRFGIGSTLAKAIEVMEVSK